MSVPLHVYESAVNGRQIFRAAYRREREDNKRLRQALEAVSKGANMTENEEKLRSHVIDLVNQINGVFAGEGMAESSTALVLAVAVQIVLVSKSEKEHAHHANWFAQRVIDTLQEENMIEWIKQSVRHLANPTEKKQ
jgi:hypothetical protein